MSAVLHSLPPRYSGVQQPPDRPACANTAPHAPAALCSASGAATRIKSAQSCPSTPARPYAASRHSTRLVSRPSTRRYAIEGPDRETTVDLVGEDSALFDPAAQSTTSWALFTGLLIGVLALIYVTWIDPSTGAADAFVASLSSLAGDSTTTMVLILAVFALAHSGLAYLRPYGEEAIGERAYRVVFALVSLPLAILAVVYFINHRYDGLPLWNIRSVDGVHTAVWLTTFASFFFLYPSTFNILEVAAVDKPKLHLWETGIIRITRHPQMVGQAMWCVAHTAWIGSSFMAATSLGLMAHHLFAVWHGDFRLKRKYGQAFEEIKARTSVVPFAAVLDGRQQLPRDYYKEFLRLPYLTITAITLGAYWAHPLMQRASYWLGW